MEANLDMHFPTAGIDRAMAYGKQPNRPTEDGAYARTTREAVNVRAHEPSSGRARGGSRSGLVRFPDDQLPGVIQELASIVLPSGIAIGISFDDVPTFDPFFHLEDPSGFRALLGDLTVGWIYIGGSGFHTHKSYVRQNPPPSITSVSPEDGDFEGGESVTITGERMGDDTATFRFGSQEATVVSNNGETAVVTTPPQTYADADLTVHTTVTTGIGTSNQTAADEFRYTRIRYQQSAAMAFAASTSGRTIAFPQSLKDGSLIIVLVKSYRSAFPPSFTTVAVTDTQGNAYTQINTYLQPFTGGNDSMSMWYAFGSDGANTVTVTPADDATLHFGILEYSGVDQAATVDDSAIASSLGSSEWTSGQVNVGGNDRLVLAGFFSGSSSSPLTAEAGVNERIADVSVVQNSALFVLDKLSVGQNLRIDPIPATDLYYLAIAGSFKPKPS